MEAGGYSEKLGNRYEANWVAYQLLKLLNEQILSVSIESIGDDEVGVDVIVENHNGIKEYHQCKVGSGNSEHWTPSKLNKVNILKSAQFQIKRGISEFHIVSPLAFKNLSDLSDSALNTNDNVNDFYKYQIKDSQKREKLFNEICSFLNLDTANKLDLEQALLFLQKFKVTQYVINRYNSDILEDKATALFSGNPNDLLNFLKHYPVEQNKLRVKITAPMLLADLESHGFTARIKPDDKRITPIIKQISKYFISTIKPHLIDDVLISRTETDEVLYSSENNAVTLIKAESGMGKSALLLEVHEKLMAKGTISIPIRLDRNRPEDNANAFGQKLGFPYSPVLCLKPFAKNHKVVFILDQLDALRWTAVHSSNALQVCQELVRQVFALRYEGLDVSVILACRDFDLEEDIALSNWVRELKDISKIGLSCLNNDTVATLIEPYEKLESLSDDKKDILTIPLWLSIYLVIAKNINAAPEFRNKLELVKEFWNDRIEKVASLGISEDQANQLINEIVSLMNSKSKLTVSENLLPTRAPKTLEALLSVGILTSQSQQLSFRHQALYDYQIGIRLFNAALDSSEKLLSEIGGFSQQTLTKREHIKYALNMLLEYDQSEFCLNVLAILNTDKIRFHLKYLVFNLLKELSLIKSPAKKMLDSISSNPKLLSHFLSNSCINNPQVINYLSENGRISSWLKSEDNELRDKAVNLLRSIAEQSPELALKELTPFINKSDEWNDGVYSALGWDIEKDSKEMFEVRKELINNGCHAHFIPWKILAKEMPGRALDLIEMLLYHYKDILCSPRYPRLNRSKNKMTNRDSWSGTEIDELEDISLKIPEEVLTRLLKIINDFIGNNNDDEVIKRWIYKEEYSNYEDASRMIEGIFSFIQSAGEQLSNKSDVLLDLVRPYLVSNNQVITHLMAKLLINLSQNHSDLVIGWLLDNPKSRFICGNDYVEPKWKLAGKLIEKFSVKCSGVLFNKLEKSIYYFGVSRDIESIKYCLESRRKGYVYSYWGETQYFLLPKLFDTRTSNNTVQMIGMLNRRFETYTEDDFYHGARMRGGFVSSPLPQANILSDKAWEKLILSPNERRNRGTWIQRGKDSVAESSVEMFSRSLSCEVKNEPIRFAHLALSLPSNIDKQYINGFYDGLSETNRENINEKYRNKWELCPPELTEEVINHFENINCEYSLIRLLDSRLGEKGWTENVRNILIDFALNSKDPMPNHLSVRDPKKSEFAEDADVHSLRSNAINCSRGRAYSGISRLFWNNETLAKELKYLIQSAIDDPHPAVNMSALDMLLPMLNYDEDFALQKFITLSKKDLRMTCGHGALHFFNNGFYGDRKEDYIELVLNMLDSPLDEIKKEAGKEIFARWFFNDLFHDELDKIMRGDDIYKHGVVSVMSQFLCEDKNGELLYKLPPIYSQLVNDSNNEILRRIAGCVRDDNYWNKSITNELFNMLVSSPAALTNLYGIFEAIGKYSGSLLEYQEQLLKLINNLTESITSENDMQNVHIRESSLIKVLQRLYDEATEDEDSSAINICLDIWDKLLRSEIYSATNATKQLENGLLS